jgi:hypothetical protein
MLDAWSKSLITPQTREDQVPDQESSFFDTSSFFKLCASSQEPLLESLSLRLEEAWKRLINNGEAESLMSDVNQLINDFDSRELYPPLDDVKILLLRAHSDDCLQAVKWASVYAGLAAIAARKANVSDARQLIANSALVLFHGYRPRSEEAYNSYVSRKGGAARNAQWRKMRNELRELIEEEIRSHRKPFNSKIEAADYFAGRLNEAAKKLDIKNSKRSMSSTIQNWFSTDDALSGLIKELISTTPTRRRSLER